MVTKSYRIRSMADSSVTATPERKEAVMAHVRLYLNKELFPKYNTPNHADNPHRNVLEKEGFEVKNARNGFWYIDLGDPFDPTDFPAARCGINASWIIQATLLGDIYDMYCRDGLYSNGSAKFQVETQAFRQSIHGTADSLSELMAVYLEIRTGNLKPDKWFTGRCPAHTRIITQR